MAFATATGYGNLPNGNFSPIIYSKQVQLAFRKSTVVGDITNSDYMGEISGQGDTVKIIKEPEVSVSTYARGTQITAQDLDDEDFNLVVDKANYYAFKMDDIEEAHSHVNFMQLATDRAAYRLADNYDQEVLAYISGYKQTTKHAVGSEVNTTVNGSVAVATAGTDELLTSMKLRKDSFASITTLCRRPLYSCSKFNRRCYFCRNCCCYTNGGCQSYGTTIESTASRYTRQMDCY